ncbi:MAG: hypothetical protein MUF06_12145 [Pirellulaceae bacterium]|jgi:hypothetical protein|nr:hypothetical protein [Pirellulaceae bacterium]
MTAFARGGVLARYFAGVCEYIFESRLGVADPPLVDYLSDLMLRFARLDSVHRVRTLSGRPAVEVADMLAEAEQRVGLARRDVHRHIGDVTLFWTGVYPESLPKLRAVERKDFFVDYCNQGKRAYYIASTIDTDRREDAPNDVLERLSVQFEMCAYGLGEVRREWERRDDEETRGLVIE